MRCLYISVHFVLTHLYIIMITLYETLFAVTGPTHKKTVLITLVQADIIKLRYEVTYSNEKHSGLDVSSSIMRLRRVQLPVRHHFLVKKDGAMERECGYWGEKGISTLEVRGSIDSSEVL